MALTLSIQLVDAYVCASRAANFLVTINNTSTSAVTLNSLSFGETTESDCVIMPPQFLTPNLPAGAGNPVVPGSSSVQYPFKAFFPTPATPGVSPSAPLGAAFAYGGQPADANFTLQATASASDGSVGSVTLPVAVLTALAPFPPTTTGTLQLQFNNGFNAVALCMGL